MKHEKGYAICGLAWHPTCSRIAYTDAEGNLGLLENVCNPNGEISSSKVMSIVEQFLQSLSVVIWIWKTQQTTFLENYNLYYYIRCSVMIIVKKTV